MKHNALQGSRFFFATALQPCPYLPGRVERRIVTELIGRDPRTLHDGLSQTGFRRSHSIAYAPACPDCQACSAIRVVADEFQLSRSLRRVMSANKDLDVEIKKPLANEELYALFDIYIQSRHGEGDMARMDETDFQALIDDTPVDTFVIEFRDKQEKLVGACLCDRISDGFSAVYSFFDPDQSRRSLGTFMILWLIGWTRELELPYMYLGFNVEGCDKMSYKSRFQPQEAFTPTGWVRLKDLSKEG